MNGRIFLRNFKQHLLFFYCFFNDMFVVPDTNDERTNYDSAASL